MRLSNQILITEIPRETIEMCAAGGRNATPYVQAAVRDLEVSFEDPAAVRTCLSHQGAWDATELADDAANVERIFWCICLHFSEYLAEAEAAGHDPYTEETPEDFVPEAGSDLFSMK